MLSLPSAGEWSWRARCAAFSRDTACVRHPWAQPPAFHSPAEAWAGSPASPALGFFIKTRTVVLRHAHGAGMRPR